MIASRCLPVLIAALAAMSCGGADEAESTIPATEPSTTAPAPSTTPPSTSPPAPSTPSTDASTTTSTPETTMTIPSDIPIVEQAIADLAARLDVDPSAIEVVSVEEVAWPDSSIGCPEPGMVYAQVIVNGSRIVLTHGGLDYEYHEGAARSPFFCPADRVAPPSSGGGDI